MKTKTQSALTHPELRAAIATAALQGLVASNFYDRYKPKHRKKPLHGYVQEPIVKVAASIATEYADALIERLGVPIIARIEFNAEVEGAILRYAEAIQLHKGGASFSVVEFARIDIANAVLRQRRLEVA